MSHMTHPMRFLAARLLLIHHFIAEIRQLNRDKNTMRGLTQSDRGIPFLRLLTHFVNATRGERIQVPHFGELLHALLNHFTLQLIAYRQLTIETRKQSSALHAAVRHASLSDAQLVITEPQNALLKQRDGDTANNVSHITLRLGRRDGVNGERKLCVARNVTDAHSKPQPLIPSTLRRTKLFVAASDWQAEKHAFLKQTRLDETLIFRVMRACVGIDR
mmetsp:Transcript_19236/g.30556  ORF Transcript_19236/g.30556 Transcript_19236/m.30556 type:complete len:218 (-) Transcript_19236:97-750(-)